MRQLADPLTLLLVAAGVVSLAIGEALDAGVIAAIVVLNATLGYVEERRAELSVRGLRELVPQRAAVIRGGVRTGLDPGGIVVGDVVTLRAGDRVPADGRLLATTHLETDESTLSGESLPVSKQAEPPARRDAPLPERPTMAFAGTTVTRGTGRLVATATATATEIGRIAGEAQAEAPVSPLRERLSSFAAVLLWAALAVCAAVGALAAAYGESIGQSFLIGVSLAVAAVPEGLPVVVTVVLAIGVRRMAERGAIVRRLLAVETLGSATVICSDKTGTLTENRMSVTRVFLCEGAVELDVATHDGAAGAEQLLADALLASDSDAEDDPIEAAIATAAERAGTTRGAALAGRTVVEVEPFDSERKRMSVIVEGEDRQRSVHVKGAPEVLVPRLAGEHDGGGLSELAARWAAGGARVLLVAKRQPPATPDAEANLVPSGLIALEDPPRAAARSGVEKARRAGVRTVMVTGDHPDTARAIAQQVGIVGENDEAPVLTGEEIERMSEEELAAASSVRTAIYARVAPEHKVRIVEALRANGEIVAMTGDGVNDAPALRTADIGVAMGRRGTDVARSVADMVLADDDYSTIVEAIRRGRAVYDNITHFVHFLLAANAGEVLVFILAIGLGLSAPLTVLQVLAVNLLTDGPPAIALGLDPPERSVMRRSPRPPRQGLLEPIRTRLLVGGLTTGLAALAAFLVGNATSHPLGQTMAFTTLVACQLAYVFGTRSNRSLLRARRNPALLAAVAGCGAALAAIQLVPPLAETFDVVAMSGAQLAMALGLALVPLAALEAYKRIRPASPSR